MFTKAISPGGNYYNNPVLLYNHDENRLVGHGDVATFVIDEVGVFGEFIVTDDDTWAEIKAGSLRGFSWFGFVNWVERDIDLVEVTVTPLPVNPQALFEMKKKALQLGLASAEDFPEYQAVMDDPPTETVPAWKAIHLGSYIESEMTMAAVRRANDNLMWRLSWELEREDKSLQERMTVCRAMFSEFAELSLKVAGALMPEADKAREAAIAIKALYKEPVGPEPAVAPGDDGGDEEVALTQEELQAIGAAAGAAAAAALQAPLGEVTTAVKSLQTQLAAPAAAPPANNAPPAAAPAASPEPESTGDRVAASKGITLDEEGVKVLAREIIGGVIQAGPARGLQTDERRQRQQTEGDAKRKALVERVKETKYEGSGVELQWGDHLRDALALEMTGNQTFDEVPDAGVEVDE